MSRKLHIPRYPSKPHPTGQARVKIGGRQVYLGKFGTKESYDKFAQAISEYLAGHGQSLPEMAQRRGELSLAELVNAHRKWAETWYVKNGQQTSEVRSLQVAMRPVVRQYGAERVVDFGPLKLRACRSWFVQQGYTRGRINTLLVRIRAVLRWGVSHELVPGSVVTDLECVPGLKRGEEGVQESRAVESVRDELVDAVRTHVMPPVWAMIQLQRLTGMRPGEVCLMRTCDVIREDLTRKIPAEVFVHCWVYEPDSHKTEHHGKRRLILLGPQAQEILRPWLRPEAPEAYLFSPAEAQEYRHRQRAAVRKTKDSKSRYQRKPPQQQKRRWGQKYNAGTYGRAVARACRKAGVEHWHPHQLRHSACTAVASVYGLEVARIMLGHARIDTTQHYDHQDLKLAAKIISQQG